MDAIENDDIKFSPPRHQPRATPPILFRYAADNIFLDAAQCDFAASSLFAADMLSRHD